jgi:hypothetical protein
MQFNPKTLLGIYLIIVGLGMTIFHKEVEQWKEDWYGQLPSAFNRGPTGTLLTVVIIVFGILAILIGVALLSVTFA